MNSLKVVILLIILLIISYFAISFIFLDLNPSNWSQISRVAYAAISLWAIIGLVIFTYNGDL